MTRLIRFYIAAIAGIVLLAVASSVLYSLLRQFQFSDILASLRAMSPVRIGVAVGVTMVAYVVMTGYDALGLRYARASFRYSRTALISFVGDSINANAGLSALLGSSIKCRLYTAAGLPLSKIVKAIGCYTAAYWLGFCVVGGGALIAGTRSSGDGWGISTATIPGIVLCVIPPAILLLSFHTRNRPLIIRGKGFSLPSPGLCAGLMAISCLDWLSAGSVLYLLLPPDVGVGFAQFMVMYLLAQLGALISQVPGGIAVFETAMILQWTAEAQIPAVTASLLVFRVIFYLVPFVCAVLLLAAIELHQAAGATRRFIRIFRTVGSSVKGRIAAE